jgi:hypothetical protein
MKRDTMLSTLETLHRVPRDSQNYSDDDLRAHLKVEHNNFMQRKLEKEQRAVRAEKKKQQNEASSVPIPPDPVAEEIMAQARGILEHGDPIAYIVKEYNRIHEGDTVLGEFLLVAIGCQLVINNDGIQPGLSGMSGGGKTHACRAMFHLQPNTFKKAGSLSNQALFYSNIAPKTLYFFDDVAKLDDTMELVIKQAMTNFRTGTYR